MCRSTRKRWSPASCSRTFARRCSSSPIPTNTTRSSSSIFACRPPPACRCGCCRRKSTACASSASTCRASACRPMPRPRTCSPARCCAYARREAEQGPVQAPRAPRAEKPTVTLIGEMFPVDPVQIGGMLELLGLAAGPVVPTREWRELYGALDCAAVAAIHPFYTACVREFEAAGRTVDRLGAGRRRWHGRLARRDRRGLRNVGARQARRGQEPAAAGDQGARWRRRRSSGRITLSGYEGSELLVGRLLVESGADLRYVGTALPAHALLGRRSRLARGARRAGPVSAPRSSRISRRSRNSSPISRSARRRSCRRRKSTAIPALYFTNLISARPLMGVAGAGSLAKVINAALAAIGALRRDEGLLRRRRRRLHAPASGKTSRAIGPNSASKQRASVAEAGEEMGSC